MRYGARALGERALAQDAVVERRRQRQQLAPAILAAPPGRDLGALLLVRELDVEAVGEPLDRGREVERVARAHVGDRVAADAAAVAVVEPLDGIDVERPRALLVERAAPDPLDSGLAQLRIRARELEQIRALLDLLDRGRRQAPAHGPAWACGRSSSSKRRRAKRSVMPATWSVARVATSLAGSPSSMASGWSQK